MLPPISRRLLGPDSLEGTLTFGKDWEGAPGLVLGGFLAAALDVVIADLVHRMVGRSVTRDFHLRFLRPVPVGVEVCILAKGLVPKGRLLDLAADLRLEDRVAVRVTTQFATLGERRLRGQPGGLPS